MTLTFALLFSSQVPECQMIILSFIHFLVIWAYSWVFDFRKWNYQIFILVKAENKYEKFSSSFLILIIHQIVQNHEKPKKWKTFLYPPKLWRDSNISENLSHNFRKSLIYADILTFPWRAILTKISMKPSLPHNFCPARSTN